MIDKKIKKEALTKIVKQIENDFIYTNKKIRECFCLYKDYNNISEYELEEKIKFCSLAEFSDFDDKWSPFGKRIPLSKSENIYVLLQLELNVRIQVLKLIMDYKYFLNDLPKKLIDNKNITNKKLEK